jgi:hypothetical protein
MEVSMSFIKKIFLYLVIIFIATTNLFAQLQYDQYSTDNQELERFIDDFGVQYEKDYPSGADNFAYVGKDAATSLSQNTFRGIYSWSLNIPATANITSGTQWEQITSATTLHSEPNISNTVGSTTISWVSRTIPRYHKSKYELGSLLLPSLKIFNKSSISQFSNNNQL